MDAANFSSMLARYSQN